MVPLVVIVVLLVQGRSPGYAGFWAVIAAIYAGHGIDDAVQHAVERYLVEFGQLMLFLLAAMTYVNSMSERNIFASLRSWLIRKGFTYRQLFWITGILSFFLSPIIDNLTTALVMEFT